MPLEGLEQKVGQTVQLRYTGGVHEGQLLIGTCVAAGKTAMYPVALAGGILYLHDTGSNTLRVVQDDAVRSVKRMNAFFSCIDRNNSSGISSVATDYPVFSSGYVQFLVAYLETSRPTYARPRLVVYHEGEHITTQPVPEHIGSAITDGKNVYLTSGRIPFKMRRISFYQEGKLVGRQAASKDINGLATNGSTVYANTYSTVAAFRPDGALLWESDFGQHIMDIVTVGDDLYILFSWLGTGLNSQESKLTVVRGNGHVARVEDMHLFQPVFHSVKGDDVRLLETSVSRNRLVTVQHGKCIAVTRLDGKETCPTSPYFDLGRLLYVATGGRNNRERGSIVITDGKTTINYIKDIGKGIASINGNEPRIFIRTNRWDAYKKVGQLVKEHADLSVLYPDGTISRIEGRNLIRGVATEGNNVYVTLQSEQGWCIGRFDSADF